MTEKPFGNEFFRQSMADVPERHKALMWEVWSATPFMADVYTGAVNSDRYREIADWCRENIGAEVFPLHKRAGAWQRGSCTMHGHTWMGFAVPADLGRFLEVWGGKLTMMGEPSSDQARNQGQDPKSQPERQEADSA